MSYSAQATLFYGILTNQDELEKVFGLIPGEDNWPTIEELVEETGLNIIQCGNMVLGDAVLGISAMTIEVEEGAIAISREKMEVPPGKFAALREFMSKYHVLGSPGWCLGATYG